MDHPDTPENDTGGLPPDTTAAAPAEVGHPQQGGAWVRLPDGSLVREAYTRDHAHTDTREE